MMTSNLLSRFLPPTGSPSIYQAIRQDDEASDASDIENRSGMTLDEENLREPVQNYELEDALADAVESQTTTQSAMFMGHKLPPKTSAPRLPKTTGHGNNKHLRPRWMQTSPRILEADEGDDDVPASLLVEGNDDDDDPKPPAPPPRNTVDQDLPVPGPSTADIRDRWEATRTQQPLRPIPPQTPSARKRGARGYPTLAAVNPKEKAMWRWTNVENLDNFLKDVYIYYLGNGIWCIILVRALNLLTLAFVIGFTTFLSSCINYHIIRGSKTLDDVLIKKCMTKISTSATLLLWLLAFFWIGKLIQYILDIRRLCHMRDFYLYLLGISDPEIQTISWQGVVSRLMTLRDSNPATAGAVSAAHRKFMGSQSKQRMDAHDIANRLMRKDNYLIALFNKDILDLTLPVPFLRNRQLFSRTLEWNIKFCILDYVFNEQGQVRPLFLKDTHRRALSQGLRHRFLFAGVMNIFVAPFIVVYFMMHYFFRYFNEYQKNPSQIGSRQYTPLAEWKFREFNELWHLFQRRINMSYPFASRYVDQFPKDKTVQVSRFVAFVTGALASVLALVSLIDPELLVFEITHDRTVLFYLGIFGTAWAVARGLGPEETDVFDPEFALLEVIDFIHYRPAHWAGRLHSDDVRSEFAVLYQMKIVIFLEEILSMIFTPFVLWFSLPKCSDRLIDFFREFTVHVDGLGYVCSFAVFDFKKGTNAISQGRSSRRAGTWRDLRDDYFSTKDGKMLASYYGFLDNYSANPKPGAPYIPTSARRRFYPPPAFPTLGSALGAEATPRADRWDQPPIRPAPVAGPPGNQPLTRTSRFGAVAGMGAPSSPLTSMLLDPHHQPLFDLRCMSRPRAQSRSRSSRQPHPVSDTVSNMKDEPVPETASNAAATPGHPGVMANGGGGINESNLDESWRMNVADDTEDSEGPAEGEAVFAGAGVLGLIHQFQRVNTEGRAGATTVGI
ncbi:hypothetical protein Egran_04220 [Elaphomyces granulatus]|uniref:Autophagy-related protein 9 n=1 Tax=Elaphomyces granulatus TaxID=519963 RepID=A0A232LV77_9EURO|nr:hypothetical protein Egran_04220 [Elaphomyces granulatus]